ncbi:Crp/Fnr family transcriptional regulator [Sphingobium sp.]|uniref:Crp/Fnr family transcriptional regulator n=1 Tax=Sphingobium sp. TaxID=1912891 RepID=UPI003BB5185C
MIFNDFLSHRRKDQMQPEDRAALEASVSDVRTLPARTTLIRQGEPVHVSTYLMEGLLCRYMDDREGQRQLVAVHVPGDFVDLHGYPLKYLDHDMASITACKIATVPHANIDILVRERPQLAKLLWFSTLIDAAMHREWIFRLGRLDAAARVAHFFCEIEAKLRVVGLSDGMHFDLPMTQHDLGEACGITPVHMNRMLRVLKNRGLLHVQGRQVHVLNRAGLAQLGEFDPAYLYIEG